jgi:SAM-dependent methyltransferase
METEMTLRMTHSDRGLLDPIMRRLNVTPWKYEGTLSFLLIARKLRESADYVRGDVLDVGSGNSPYRQLFPGMTSYIGMDPANPSSGVRGQAEHLPFRSGRFDAILMFEVLEHLPEPGDAVAEGFRVLRAGGYLVGSTPFMVRVHGAPHDYYRYTEHGLRHLLEKQGFDVVQIKPRGGAAAAIGQLLTMWVVEPNKNRRRIGKLATAVGALIQRLSNRLDLLLNAKGHEFTNGYVFVATKKA